MFGISNWEIAKKVLFHLDPEMTHHLAGGLIRAAWGLGRPVGFSLRRSSNRVQPVWVLGMPFLSPVGLAAGFDKNADFLQALPSLGFGFAEIGTVTPRPQPGNPTPRLFRDPQNSALFNRMGFNNIGCVMVARRLEKAKSLLPAYFRVGVNVGKNKDTPNERSADDYIRASAPFEGLADYFVINVSSPNTRGLRDLQTVEGLKPIVDGIVDRISGWRTKPPLLLKLAPEVSDATLFDLFRYLEPRGIDGWVLSNTVKGEWRNSSKVLEGGWSGGPLTLPSRKMLKDARRMTSKPIISVGGILSVEEAATRIEEGADLIQVYTGWIYRGPLFPLEIESYLGLGGRLRLNKNDG